MKKHTKVIIAAAAVIGAAVAVSKYFCDFALKKGGGLKLRAGFTKNSEIDDVQEQRLDLLKERTEKYRAWFTDNAEDVYLLTNGGVKVHALLAKAEGNSRKYAVVCHGYKDSAAGMGFAAYNFVKMGYNVLAPDGRASGKTEGGYIGMGWLERCDVKGYINFILARDPHAEIVLYGISMGASEVMMAAGEKLPDNVKAIVEDCGYTSVWDEFAVQFRNIFHLPAFPLLYLISAYAKIFVGYGFKEASAVEALKRSKIPVLMIHGTEDDFVPFSMLDRLYNAAAGEKEKLEINGAKHMQSDLLETERYWKTVEAFTGKYTL